MGNIFLKNSIRNVKVILMVHKNSILKYSKFHLFFTYLYKYFFAVLYFKVIFRRSSNNYKLNIRNDEYY